MIIKKDPEEFQNYLSDAANYKGFAEAVYIPESETELISLIQRCNNDKTLVTISGNGTGLNGGRVPEGGIVISLEKLNRIIEINHEEKFIRVQPGVLLKDLQNFVEEQKLFYPPDPTETNCFIGATVATNSSGAKTFKYGSTRNYILALKIILADGDTISLERGNCYAKGFNALLKTDSGKPLYFEIPNIKMPDTKNASAYYCKENMDLLDLFIGSEGTLGLISEVKLKLLDLPQNVFSCISFFPAEENALDFIDEVRKQSRENNNSADSQIKARAIEFFDRNSLLFLKEDFPNIPSDSHAAVWFENDFTENEDLIIEEWMNLLTQFNCSEDCVWIAVNKTDQDKFHVFRHAIAVKVNETVTRRNLKKVGTDNAVPVNHFRNYYYWMKKIVEQENLKYVVYGHFGDCHPHLNILPQNEQEYIKALELYSKFCIKAVELGGTVSAEHGIGKLKRKYLQLMYGEANISKMAKLKLIFDKNKILNIGNIIDKKFFNI